MAGFGNNLVPGLGDWIAPRRNTLAGLGAGLLQGRPGSGVMEGRQLDDAYATQQKAESERQAQMAQQQALRSQYATWFTERGKPDIAKGIADGLIDPAEAYWEEIKPKPAETVKPTSSMQEYEFARSQGYAGTFQQYETDMKKAGATNIDFNQNQGSAAGFADRMAAADQIIGDPKLTPAMTDPIKPVLGSVPGVGNYMVGPEFQMAEQAQRDFVNAILRRESGAVISPSEFDNAKKQYFPQPGDSPEVIQQKAANRQNAIAGVQRAAGPNYQAPPVMSGGGVVDYSEFFK